MRDFVKITPGFWIGQTGRQLREDPVTQLTAFYLLTSPYGNRSGWYYCPVATLMTHTGISEEEVHQSLSRLGDIGFCAYDSETEWVWIKEMDRFVYGAQTFDPFSVEDEAGNATVTSTHGRIS